LHHIFPHYLINATIFEKRKPIIEYKMCFSYIQLLFDTFLILRRTDRDIVINVYRSACKVPVIIVRVYWNLNFLNIFSKKKKYSNIKFHENPSSFFPYGRTDGDRQTGDTNSRFSVTANAPKSRSVNVFCIKATIFFLFEKY